MTTTENSATAPTPADSAVVVIGAGPAGLTAAYELGRRGRRSRVLEADDVVGGISRTVVRDGWRFDIGGHRFFTKVPEVRALWHDILPPEDFLLRPRMSRIFNDGKFFDYPLRAGNVLRTVGPVEATRCVLSYGWARVRPPKDQTSFEGWTAARFGWRLYRRFFKTYTEKVWGVPADQIHADWAAQRIKNLTLGKAVVNAILPQRNQKDITSLIEEFEYPKYGPGMMWERCRDLVVEAGSDVVMQTRVTRIRHEGGRAVAVETEGPGGAHELACDHVISSMPFPHLLRAMDPPVPDPVRAAADGITHRDYLTVALVVPEEFSFPDNWIYVHDATVKLGRVQNYGSWSPFMVKEGRTCLGLEYFVFEGDELWSSTDEDLIEFGKDELARLGLVPADRVEAGYVVRVPMAYPTYDEHYRANVDVLREWIADNAANVHPIGRNGMHKYNNQDHSMFTALLTVENICDGTDHDIWAVNVEEEYHEEAVSSNGSNGSGGTGRDAPVVPRRTPV
jgi:protoporphyrinogen oxidase